VCVLRGAGIGPVIPASQRKDQDVMLRLLKSMETIVCQWSSNSFCENSVCPPWCLMFVFWNLRKPAKVTSALQTVSQRCRWTCMEIRYQCNAINTDKKNKWNMSEMERCVFDVFNMLCSPGIMENDIFYVATWNYPNRKKTISWSSTPALSYTELCTFYVSIYIHTKGSLISQDDLPFLILINNIFCFERRVVIC